jgi:hypothetical protein
VAAPSLDYSATDRYCAEELLILLINFMKIYRTDFQDNGTGTIRTNDTESKKKYKGSNMECKRHRK